MLVQVKKTDITFASQDIFDSEDRIRKSFQRPRELEKCRSKAVYLFVL